MIIKMEVIKRKVKKNQDQEIIVEMIDLIIKDKKIKMKLYQNSLVASSIMLTLIV